MIFAEPARTKFDLRFAIRGIPVRVSPWFWLVAVLLSFRSGSLASISIWVVVVFASILFHELGHAWAMQRYGCHPKISLHGLGGLASADQSWAVNSPKRQIIVAAAGPMAGFALAAITIIVLLALDYSAVLLGLTLVEGRAIANPLASAFVHHLLFINIVWGLVNLVPVLPLDGAQIVQGLFFAGDPRSDERALRLSVICGVALTLVGFWYESFLVVILFASLTYSSYRGLRQMGARVLVRPHFVGRAQAWWRAWKRYRKRSRRAQHVRLVDQELSDALHESDMQEDVSSPEVEKTAQDLLKSLSDDIRRDRKHKDVDD